MVRCLFSFCQGRRVEISLCFGLLKFEFVPRSISQHILSVSVRGDADHRVEKGSRFERLWER